MRLRSWLRRITARPTAPGLAAALLMLAGVALIGGGVVAWVALYADEEPPAGVRVIDLSTPESTAAVVVAAAPTATPTERPRATPLAEPTPAPVPEVVDLGWEWVGDDAPELVGVDPRASRVDSPLSPTRLVIPSIRVDSPVVNVSLVTRVRRGNTVSAWQVARDAVGFHNSSAPPGTLGNSVMSGHNNAWGQVFRYLTRVQRGDEVQVFVGERVLRYVIEDKLLVRDAEASDQQRRQNATWIGPTDDERLTLVSCWPYRNPTHRVIVVARPTG